LNVRPIHAAAFALVAVVFLCQEASADVRELERAFVEVNRKLAPSVVSLVVTGSPSQDDSGLPLDEKLRRFFGEKPRYGYKLRGVGSGLIIDPTGYVLTNAHVVTNVEEVVVILQDGRRLPGKLLGRAPSRDLAVIKIESDRPVPAARFADVAGLRVGQYAIALGNPFGLAKDPEPTMTVGHISALGRTIPAPEGEFEVTNVIQTDAAINPGNSGGPLVNIDGKVIGINTAIFTTSGGSIGIGFAIPMNKEALDLIEQLKRGTTPEVGWIGIRRCQALTPRLARYYKVEPGSGIVIVEVAEEGPAAKAGIMSGDLLVSVGGKSPKLPSELVEIVKKTPPGKKLGMIVLRQSKRHEISVEVVARDFTTEASLSSPRAWRGLEVENLSPGAKAEMGLAADAVGVRVSKVSPGSAAAEAGIKQGDLLVRINQTDIATAEAFRNATKGIEPRQDALVKLRDRIVLVAGAKD